MRSIRAAWRLIRPLNFLMFFGGVAVGAALMSGADAFIAGPVDGLLWAMAGAAFIGANANALNDVFDLGIDRWNRPDRPLPAGDLQARTAAAIGIVLTVLGMLTSLRVSLLHLVIAGAAAVLIALYNARLKRMPLVGNVAVAVVIATALVFGALAVATEPLVPAVWVGAAFAASLTFARELAKDIEDVRGDRAEGARTLPVVAPLWVSHAGVHTAILISLLAVPVAAYASRLGPPFLALAVPAAGAMLMASWTLLVAPHDDRRLAPFAGRCSAWLKGAMVLGVVALFAAAL